MQFLLLPFQRYCNKNSILRFYLSIFGRTNCFGITFSRFLCQHHKALSFWFLKQSFVIFCCLNHSRILLWDGIVQSVCGDLKKKRYFLVFFPYRERSLYMHNLYIVHEELLPFFTWRFSCCSRKYSFDTNYHRKQSSWTTISTETLLFLYQPACILRSWGRNLLNGPASLKSTQFFSVRVFFRLLLIW